MQNAIIESIKVTNMLSPKSNRPVANQYIIRVKSNNPNQVAFDLVYFQSYNSIIACVDYQAGKTYLDPNYWDYSRTTGKYRNMFLGETTAETKANLKSGKYQFLELN